MLNDTLELLETNKDEIARRAAETVQAEKLRPFAELTIPQITRFFLPTLEMALKYLRNGNIAEWHDYNIDLGARMNKFGFSLEERDRAGKILTSEAIKLVEQKLSGPENEATRHSLIRRIESLSTLGNISSFNAQLKKDI